MNFKKLLFESAACPEAIKWAGRRSLKTAWAKCERVDWMLWLAYEAGVCLRSVDAAATATGCGLMLCLCGDIAEFAPKNRQTDTVRKLIPYEIIAAAYKERMQL